MATIVTRTPHYSGMIEFLLAVVMLWILWKLFTLFLRLFGFLILAGAALYSLSAV